MFRDKPPSKEAHWPAIIKARKRGDQEERLVAILEMTYFYSGFV